MTNITHSPDNAYDKEYWPSFGVTDFQAPMCIVTVFAIGGSGRDCAAYRGITKAAITDETLAEIRAGGNKISEREARDLFEFGDLVWRR